MIDFFNELIRRYPALSVCEQSIRISYTILEECFAHGKKLLIAGNGGSCSDSDHICGELLKSFIKKRLLEKGFIDTLIESDNETGTYLSDKLQGSLPAISLGNQTALMTASINDVDGNIIFAQQVNGFGVSGDVFLGISTSGNSKDIVYAMVVAKAKGLKSIALTGQTGGKIAKMADTAIIVPEKETYKIQELHLPIYHALCLQLEERFFK